jgi:hypothetical protein
LLLTAELISDQRLLDEAGHYEYMSSQLKHDAEDYKSGRLAIETEHGQDITNYSREMI